MSANRLELEGLLMLFTEA